MGMDRPTWGFRSMSTVALASDVTVPAEALTLRFVLASGPGGQNVNKVATAVELRFTLARSGLSYDQQRRLKTLAGSRATTAGEIIIFAQSQRSQIKNRHDAYERLADLVRRSRFVPKRRKKTRPSKGAIARRLDTKKRRGSTKQTRSKPGLE